MFLYPAPFSVKSFGSLSLSLFLSSKTAKGKLKTFKDTGQHPPGCSALDLWDARTLIEARCHADTKEQLPTAMCFAAYAPMQPPIILGMLWPGAGLGQTLFMQWYILRACFRIHSASPNTPMLLGSDIRRTPGGVLMLPSSIVAACSAWPARPPFTLTARAATQTLLTTHKVQPIV